MKDLKDLKDLEWIHDEKTNKFYSSYDCSIWNKEITVKIIYSNKSGNISKHDLINSEIAIIEMLERVNKSKSNIVSFITNTGIFDLATSWLNSHEKIIKDNINYFKNDKNELIPVDITEEDFIKYIFFNTLEIRQTDNRIIADIFLITKPDCFSEHLVEIFLLKDIALNKYKISFNGIVNE